MAITPDPDLLEIAKRYLAAIETGVPQAFLSFFAPDVVQEEFPNRLVPSGATRDLAALRQAAERGQHAVLGQHFEITSAMADENRVAIEAIWTASLAVPLGSIPAGGQMRARLAIFLEFRDGLIVRQRNYDCFDPF